MITAKILELRRDYLCSSDYAGILGISPFVSPHEVWMSKVYQLAEHENTAMRSGNENEAYIVADIAKHFGFQNIETTPDKLWRISSEYPLFACNLDGDNPAVEAKLTSMDDEWGRDGSETIPKHFYVQVQEQMLVTGYSEVYVGVWICKFGLEKRYYEIKRDNKLIDEMIVLGPAWWNKYVETARQAILSGEEIPFIPKQTKPVIDAYRRVIPIPKTVKSIGFEWVDYEDAQAELKAAQKKVDIAKSKVLEIKGDAEALEIPGGDYYMKQGNGLRVVKRERVME